MWEPDDRMKRREFMILLSGTASWPLAARAQPLPKLPTIGVLGPTNAAVAVQWTAALVQRLRELGWIEGRTVAIEYRWAHGRAERAAPRFRTIQVCPKDRRSLYRQASRAENRLPRRSLTGMIGSGTAGKARV